MDLKTTLILGAITVGAAALYVGARYLLMRARIRAEQTETKADDEFLDDAEDVLDHFKPGD